MPDGSELILENNEDNGLKKWYESNIDTKEKPAFIYPIQIQHKDGSNSTLSNDEELSVALKTC